MVGCKNPSWVQFPARFALHYTRFYSCHFVLVLLLSLLLYALVILLSCSLCCSMLLSFCSVALSAAVCYWQFALVLLFSPLLYALVILLWFCCSLCCSMLLSFCSVKSVCRDTARENQDMAQGHAEHTVRMQERREDQRLE